MPILRVPVEPAKSPARLQLREQSGAFLGTQELGEDVPDLPLDVGAESPGDFREGEREAVVFVGGASQPRLRLWEEPPTFIAIADLAGDGGDSFGGQAPQRAQEFRDHDGTCADDCEQIARNLPGQRQHRIGVFTQLLGQPADGLFARRRLLAPLDLAQVTRLEADATGDFAQGEGGIGLRLGHPSCALPIEPDGRLGEAFYTDQHAGPPPGPGQPSPHAHGAVFSKDGQFVYVAELGLDRIYSYRFDAAERVMTPFDPAYVELKSGSAPRRLQLHPNGGFLYVNLEAKSAVSVFEVNGGSLKEIQSLSTLPADYTGANTTAEIQIDQTGRFLYVSNRGHDSIAFYRVDPVEGTLVMVETMPSLGKTPRNLTIDPTNNYLFSANQAGENVVVFRIDHETGHLTPANVQVPLVQPARIAVVNAL